MGEGAVVKGFVYLALLLVSIGGVLWLDFRYRLFYWHDAWRALAVTVAGLVALALADVGGIALGIFKRGDAEIATGVVVAPQLPLEEPVFLLLLILSTMICYTGAVKMLGRRGESAS